MNDKFLQTIIGATKAKDLYEIEIIQNLWSGYGQIVRYGLHDSDYETVIAKHIRLPKQETHPRGWNSNLSHTRKVRSYEIEIAWYKQFSTFCDDNCRVPHLIASDSLNDEVLIVLEDLDKSGFPGRRNRVSWNEMQACIKWLANFHVTFMHEKPSGLWETGTYWHLDTRPEELEVLNDKALKNAAKAIDEKLHASPFHTFVHGDAKLANFCFSDKGLRVAAVDFQYVGGGCGMKDLAYFVGSCFYEDDCERYEAQILDFYFREIRQALHTHNSIIDADALEQNWRELYPVAWTDFHRFLKGWSPGHWKINSYSERLTKEVIKNL